MKFRQKIVILNALMIVIFLTSCGLPKNETLNRTLQTSFRTDTYIVQTGDTLYSIAWRYQMDHKNLIRWNNLRPPYRLAAGQKLVISRQNNDVSVAASKPADGEIETQSTVSTTPSAKTTGLRTSRSSISAQPLEKRGVLVKNLTEQTAKIDLPAKNMTSSSVPSVNRPNKHGWQWPTEGRLVGQFVAGELENSVIKIAGIAGQEIRAASSGEIVYSGNMASYGNLLIIKHNSSYISSYSQSGTLLVNEGDTVIAGERIAVMGVDNSGKPLLKFGIRLDGKPVDPLQYLPKR